MVKRQLLLLTFLLVMVFMGKAQQTPSFTEYNYNPFLLNSAYAGVMGATEATISNIGFGSPSFDGAPRSFSFTLNSPFHNEKMGLGLGVINDEIGVTSATQIFGAYSYRIILNDNAYPYWKIYDRSFISFGLNAGALLYNQDLLRLGLQDDPNFIENISATLPSVGAGILFGFCNFFAGFSAPNLLGDTFANQDNLKLSRPIYGYTGYHFVTDRYNPNFIIKPSMLLKYEKGAPMQIDANLALSFKNTLEIGAGFRTSNTVNAFLGCYLFKNFRAVYSYSQGGADSPLGNSHGIILSYRSGDGFAIN